MYKALNPLKKNFTNKSPETVAKNSNQAILKDIQVCARSSAG